MFADLLRSDRERYGPSFDQAAWTLGVTPAEYRRLELGEVWPGWATHDRICELFGWPQTFVK